MSGRFTAKYSDWNIQFIPDNSWKQKNGQWISYKKMSWTHLTSTIKMLQKNGQAKGDQYLALLTEMNRRLNFIKR